MQALLSNTYTMVFAGTIMVGVLMLAVSLLAFFVLAVAGFSIHGLMILSRKAFISAFSLATLISKQPPEATGSTDSTADAAQDATVHARKTMFFASIADSAKTRTSQANRNLESWLHVVREDGGSPVHVMPAGRHFTRKRGF